MADMPNLRRLAHKLRLVADEIDKARGYADEGDLLLAYSILDRQGPALRMLREQLHYDAGCIDAMRLEREEAELRSERSRTASDIANRLKSEGMHCNCDLDNWQPDEITGHSHVCRIHQAAMKELRC